MTLLAGDIAEQPGLLQSRLLSQSAALSQARALVALHHVVRLVGIGSSRHVAGYGAACLEVFGDVPASVLSAPGGGVPLPRLGPGQLLVIISQSGQTPALLTVAASARACGATVLAVTNGPGSALEQAADVVLPADAGAESVVPATKSVSAMMLLLRALAGSVDPAAVHRLSAVVGGLVGDSQLVALVALHALPDLVVCGGFAGQWVADEVALKLAEVTAHLAVPESVVDFLHGPAAVAAPTLAFLDPTDPNATAVASRGSVLTVGPSPDYSLPLPGTGDASLDAITRVVAGQCLALHWAQCHGVDPDDPRGLKKVTLTA